MFLEVLLAARRESQLLPQPKNSENDEVSKVREETKGTKRKKVKPIISPQEMELAIYILTVFLSSKLEFDKKLVIKDRFTLATVYSAKVETFKSRETKNINTKRSRIQNLKPEEILDPTVVSRTLSKLRKMKLIEYTMPRSSGHDEKIRIRFLPICWNEPTEHIKKFTKDQYGAGSAN